MSDKPEFRYLIKPFDGFPTWVQLVCYVRDKKVLTAIFPSDYVAKQFGDLFISSQIRS